MLTSEACGPDPLTLEKVCVAKFHNLKTYAMVGVVTDANGQVVGFDDLEARRAAAWAALPPFERKADRALQTFVAEAEAGLGGRMTASVGIFVSADPASAVSSVRSLHPEMAWLGDQPLPATAAAADVVEAELYDANAEVYGRAEAALATKIEALGGKVVYLSTSAPLLFAEIPPSLAQQLASLPEVPP